MPNSQAFTIELCMHSTVCFILYVLVYVMPLVEPSHMTMYRQVVSTQLISIVNLAYKTPNFKVNFFTLCLIKGAAYKMGD